MSVLVVDLARFGVGEGFVGFCDFDEFLLRALVSTVGGVSGLCNCSVGTCRNEKAIRVLIGVVFLA